MALLPDFRIREYAQNEGMIEPFVDKQVREGVISYGLSSYGYDIRVADEFKIFTMYIRLWSTPRLLTRVQWWILKGMYV